LIELTSGPARRAAYEASGAWDETTLPVRVAEHAARDGSRVAVVDLTGRRSKTFDELHRDAGKVAGFLRSVGVEPGDVVGIQLPNWYETTAIVLGALTAGAVVNPILPIYRHKELRHMLSVGQARVLFTPPSTAGSTTPRWPAS